MVLIATLQLVLQLIRVDGVGGAAWEFISRRVKALELWAGEEVVNPMLGLELGDRWDGT